MIGLNEVKKTVTLQNEFCLTASPLVLTFISLPVSKLPAYSCTLSPTLRVKLIFER